MIGIQITELKDFMGKLLKSDCFNSFLLEEATITTAATYRIDGRINKDFYQEEDSEYAALSAYEFMPWSHISPFCFDLIKGKRTPLNFKFVMHLRPELLDALLAENVTLPANTDSTPAPSAQLSVKAAVLTIKYDGTGILLTTAISYQTFVLEKTPDKLWDSYMLQFLEEKGLVHTVM